MKKLISACIAFIMLALFIPVSVAETTQFEYLPDGSYFVTETNINSNKASSTRGSLTTSKSSSYYDPSGVKQWTMVLHGSFTYNGTSATCTAASVTYSIYSSNWHFVSKNAWTSGNTAHGSLSMDLVVAGIKVLTVTKSLTITCDENGNVT